MYSDFRTIRTIMHAPNQAGLSGLLWVALLLCTPVAWSAESAFLTLGPFDQGVYDGTPPFNVTGDCQQPGDDCGDNDQRVRTNDLIQFAWSVVAGQLSAEEADGLSVIVEQTLNPASGADIQFSSLPAACLAPPAGNGGASPASTIIDNSDGSTTLLCNLGSLGNGEQKSFSVAVQPQTTSANGSSFTSTQIVYGVDASGESVIEAFEYSDSSRYIVSAAPAFDLIGNRVPISRGEVSNGDIGNGLEPGFIYQYTAHIATASERGALGIQPLSSEFTFSPGVYATLADGRTAYDLKYSIIECSPNRFEWSGSVFGNLSITSSDRTEQAVDDSGDCSVSGDADSGFQLTVDGANTNGHRFPTTTVDGTPLIAGPYFVAAYGIRLFIPFSEIDRADGNIGDDAGQIQLGACLSDFDPDSASGVSNYLTDSEPGYNGTAMPNGDASNNCAGVTTAQLTTSGNFSFRALSVENDQGTLTQYGPLISAYHAGDGVVEAGQSFGTMLHYLNNGNTPLSEFTACTVFDNTVQKITDREQIGATSGAYAYEGTDSPAAFDPSQWEIQYGTAPITGDDPLDTDNDGISDFNPVTGRFEGVWARLAKLRCDSPSIVWHQDISNVDPAYINAVRFSPITPSTLLEPGQEIRLITPLSPRTEFFGGPRDGQTIPTGTVAAAYGSYRSVEIASDWHTNLYQPSPENNAADGDRMTIARARVDIALETSSPAAVPGEVTTVLAGNSVIWKLQPVVSSRNYSGELIDNLALTLTLSENASYNAGCTLTTPGGVTPDSITTNVDDTGSTRFTWYLGDISVAESSPPLFLCADTNHLVQSASAVQATAYASADNAVSSAIHRQTVSLGQAGAMFTDVNVAQAQSAVNDDQQYTLRWTNLSATSVIQKPTVINVLPFNGDDEGLSVRSPASQFNGSLSLTSEPEVTFLNGSSPVDSETSIGTLYFTADSSETIDHNAADNTSDWCGFNANRFIPENTGNTCPSTWADVTAIKFVSNYDLGLRDSDRPGMQMTYTISTRDNAGGDRYTNIFGTDTESLPLEQFLISRHASVSVATFSISGILFAAIDNDIDYDAGVDAIVPDGVTLELRDAQTDQVVGTATTSIGQYTFDALSPGSYVVSIPSHTFDLSGDLPGWSPAIDQNESNSTIDIEYGEPASVGIRTFAITLSTTDTNGNRTNPVVDLALQTNDADSDGIADSVEFGPSSFIVGSVDTDGDGIPDYIDTDSDADSIADSIEGTIDTDGDGIPNYIDTDSDADGTPDSIEGNADTDADGIANYIDNVNGVDTDGDTLPDAVEGNIDTDGDGIPDNEDTDSDADGIPDEVEKNTDTDRDGIANYIDTDSDADGIPDSVEGTTDANGNGVPDYIDNITSTDSDGDSIPDSFEGNGDTDGDGTPDSNDLDSDADGISDRVETIEDSDGDGRPNYVDLDSDNDSLPDSVEGAGDSDGDQIADFLDLDSDNDSLTDIQETSRSHRDIDGNGQIDNIIDANTDGIDDSIQASGVFIIDTDMDNVSDQVDLDSDNDGIPDVIETLGPDADQNRDGIIDIFIDENKDGRNEQTTLSVPITVDTDLDGVPDFQDLDSDADGRSDVIESGGADTNGDSIVDAMTDSDKDGTQEPADADQTGGKDADADGIDDNADIDFTAGIDTDGDGIVDAIDPDANGDGYVDTFSDPLPSEQYPDFDGNGTPDFQQALTGVVTTGVGGEGVGCTLGPRQRIDPTLMVLLLISSLVLWRRQRMG